MAKSKKEKVLDTGCISTSVKLVEIDLDCPIKTAQRVEEAWGELYRNLPGPSVEDVKDYILDTSTTVVGDSLLLKLAYLWY